MINPEGGFLLINKPLTWTSFQAVNKIKFLIKYNTGTKMKVGHAGTLDPLATGLLIVCYGKMTKQIAGFQDMPKEYTGTIKLGATTPSFDLETEIDQTYPTEHITEGMVRECAKKMIGLQKQKPPIFSAKKIDGQRAYELARSGVKMEMKENEIEVFNFEIDAYENSVISFRIACSKGTYIRSMANDLGERLSCGGHLTSLCRTAIGKYRNEDAISLEQLELKLKEMNETKQK